MSRPDYPPRRSKVDPNFPDRPQSDEFWALSRIVNELDDLAESQGWLAAIGTIPIQPQDMLYMARQRAGMALELMKNGPDGQPMPEKDRLGLVWTDAFAAGVRFGMEQTPAVDQVLDGSLDDGNRRQGQ